MAKTYETNQPCIVCGMEGQGMVTFHHIKTRKAYPHLENKSWNKIPACAWCHVPGFHQKGLSYMAKTFHQVRFWLEKNGWYYEKKIGKWFHDGVNGVVEDVVNK
jgi:hypothetical protein